MAEREDKFHDGIAGRFIREHLRNEFDRMASEDRRKKKEEDAKPWFDSGGLNIMRSDRLPKSPRPTPSHPGDSEKHK